MERRSMNASRSSSWVVEIERSMNASRSSSWVVEIERSLEHTNPSVEMARWKQQSIYRVPSFIKDMTNSKAYRPQVVSLGPLHHGEPNLLDMEKHKSRAVAHMVKRAAKPLEDFVAAIDEVADELQGAYGDLDEKWRGASKGRFVEMMVADGCFLLELARTDEQVVHDYASNDPVFSAHHFHSLWPFLRNDMIAMENQVPLIVLQRLLAVELGTSPSATSINTMMAKLLDFHDEDMNNRDLALHLLDIYHRKFCGASPRGEGSADNESPMPTAVDRTEAGNRSKNDDRDESPMPCAVDLTEAGIGFKKSNTESIHDVEFKNGVLSLPLLKFDDGTETILLNLMVFEWLHSDARREVASYIYILDQIIKSERDVTVLKSQGVLINMVGTDKKVVEMFHTLTKLTWPPDDTLNCVQSEIKAYSEKRWNRWRANFVQTYLSNPWVFISLVAAIVLLIATLMQTVYTVIPFYKK